MPRNGAATREKILDVTEALVLDHGFAATSIDMVLAKARITKGALFYHFKSKADLARSLVQRYAGKDDDLLNEFFARAETLSRDPLQQLLIFLGLMYEVAHELVDPHPGCLFASYCYESEQFDEEIKGIITKSMLDWRGKLAEKLRDAMKRYPTQLKVDPESLADYFIVTTEGSYVMSKIFSDPKAVAEHITHYKNYLELLFSKAR